MKWMAPFDGSPFRVDMPAQDSAKAKADFVGMRYVRLKRTRHYVRVRYKFRRRFSINSCVRRQNVLPLTSCSSFLG